MNISGTGGGASCFQHVDQIQNFQIYEGTEDDIVSISVPTPAGQDLDSASQTLVYNLNVLEEKLQKMQSVVMTMLVHQQHLHRHDSIVAAATTASSLIQDIVVAASSMMYAFQQVSASISSSSNISNSSDVNIIQHHQQTVAQQQRPVVVDNLRIHRMDPIKITVGMDPNKGMGEFSSSGCDIIELDAADLLAKYKDYCQVCGKGFKRDANLRMHMRAHGDQYKTNEALSNPMKASSRSSGTRTASDHHGDQVEVAGSSSGSIVQRKYSCPHEGCRWNRKHEKFQPLKSMICAKNHYKRSHCPKMYVCNRCNTKQFSVLSDLRTHEKHCGELKWQCPCGTTFSRKDKLMAHLALFAGHAPVTAPDLFARQQ